MRIVTREGLERAERERLSSDAAFSDASVGRQSPEDPDPLRTCFQCDRDRILHSKSFRRLAHKTQVFLAPEGDHYRTRLIHTLEVSQVARSIARPLGLNEDLVEAIALGHDLGHTPFGHVGERALSHAIARHCEREGMGTTSRAPVSSSCSSATEGASTSRTRWSTASATTRAPCARARSRGVPSRSPTGSPT